MNGILLPLLFALAGLCAYATLHHAMIGWRSPLQRAHLWFALLCLVMVAYLVAKASAYQADSVRALVEGRRWEATLSLLLFAIFPWFVRTYTRLTPLWLPTVLSLVLTVVLVANVLLPFGANYVERPELAHVTLPWGEEVADLRVHRRGGWHNAGWLGFMLVFAYGLHASWQQHRRGEHRSARTLATAMAVFMAFMLFNQLVNRGLVEFPHTAEFGFLALLLVMSLGMTRALRETERRMQTILDQVPALVYLKDLQGRYLLSNRPFAEMFKLGDCADLNRTDHDLFPPAQAESLSANDREVLESGEPCRFEERVEIAGQARTYLTLKFPINDADGVPYGLCGVSTDITDLRQRETEMEVLRRQLRHSNRVAQLGTLSNSLAHELNQPLTAILSNAEAGLHLLGRGKSDPQEIREILQDIVRDDGRAFGIIRGLRDMLRQRVPTCELFSLADVVAEILALMRSELLERGVVSEQQLDRDCPVRADRVQIGQVILNLMMNALDAVEHRPADQRRIDVSVSRGGDGSVRATVRDTGAGLPGGKSEEIFDAFFSTKNHGLGMGLALSRSIIEAHGGRIWACDNPDQGATVAFQLPLAVEEGSS